MGTDDVLISRFRRQNSDSIDTLTLNERTGSFSIGTYFSDGGDGRDLTMILQTADAVVEMAAVDQFRRGGSSFGHWTLTPEAIVLLDSLNAGDRFIFALARAARVELSGEIVAGTPELSGTLSVVNPNTVPLQGEIRAGIPELAGTLTITNPEPVDLSGEIVAGTPQLSGMLTITPPSDVVLSGEIVAGTPTLSGTLTVTPPGSIALSGEIVAGTPELSGTLTIINPDAVALAGEIVAGTPELSGTLTIIPPGDVALAGEILAGTPTLSGTLTIRDPDSVALSGEILAGIPALSGTLTITNVPNDPTSLGTTTSSTGTAPTQLELAIQIVSGGSDEVFTAYVTGVRLVKETELLEWQDRAVVGFSLVN